MAKPYYGAVYVCAERDIECGSREANWCAKCPQRRATPSSPVGDAELTQLRAQNMLLLHLYDAVAKLVKAKGRFHTEQNYSALVAAYDLVRTADTPAASKENT